MNRRKFFAFLPVAPVALIVEGAKAESINDAPNKKDAHFTFVNESSSVTISPGKDGNLWMRSRGGEWKRIVTQ